MKWWIFVIIGILIVPGTLGATGEVTVSKTTCTLPNYGDTRCPDTITVEYRADNAQVNRNNYGPGLVFHFLPIDDDNWGTLIGWDTSGTAQINWIQPPGITFASVGPCDGVLINEDGREKFIINQPLNCEHPVNSPLDQKTVTSSCANPFEWKNGKCDCPDGTTWDGSVCEPDPIVCNEECTITGVSECAGDGYRVCEAVPDTECDTRWGEITACADGESCAAGVCETDPEPEPEPELTINNLLANYALFLMEEAQGEYAIECGAADVLNNQLHLPEISGYPNPPGVCVLEAGNKKAVMFALDKDTDPKEVITHFLNYGDQAASNVNIIKTVDENACVDAALDDNGWGECSGAVSGVSYEINMYYQFGDPTTYLITYGFEPSFAQNPVERLIGFFVGLFTNEEIPNHLEAFSRGYFAFKSGKSINAIYESTSPHDPGKTTITYEGFGFDVSQLSAEADYSSSGGQQVLVFESLTPQEWKKLTAATRIS